MKETIRSEFIPTVPNQQFPTNSSQPTVPNQQFPTNSSQPTVPLLFIAQTRVYLRKTALFVVLRTQRFPFVNNYL